ncbi:MAG: sugar dehydrogenase complex small subunit [Acetobacteraceae bacterium]
MADRLGETIGSAGVAIPRRMVLAGFVAAYSASLIPWALAQPANDASHAAFLAMSGIIAGKQVLNPKLGQCLYDALVTDDPEFPQQAQSLLAFVEAGKIDPPALQKALDDQKPLLAQVPLKIATAWFLGIVGGGTKARCIAYETALNAVIVSDVLKPPTYAYGAYGSWSSKPL